MSGGRVSDLRLFLRSVRAFGGGLILLALVALVATTALAGWPRVTSEILGGELRHGLQDAGAGGRDLATSIRTGSGMIGPFVDPVRLWDGLPGVTGTVRSGMRAPLRAVTAAGDSAARSTELPTSAPEGAARNSRYSVAVEAYRDLEGSARLVSGTWPPASSGEGARPVPVVVSVKAADLLGWRLGELRRTALADGIGLSLQLVGTIEPKDARTDFWDLDTARSLGHFVDGGDSGNEYGGVAWVAPETWRSLAPRFDGTVASLWFPVVADRFSAEEVPAVRSALGAFLASPPVVSTGGAARPLAFASAVQQPIDDFLARAQPAQTLFAILVSGPLVVALAVLAQGARLAVDRRRGALTLMAARGAFGARLRGELAAQGLLVSVPAAALGLLAALLLTPAAKPFGFSVGLAVVCAALVPAALLLAAGSLAGGRPTSAGGGNRTRWAWVAEVVVIGLAVAGVMLLTRRGLSSGGAGLEVDPLTALTPVLVALAACVVVVRLAGYPIGWIASALRRGRGSVAFLGASAARRSRSGLLWPVFTLVAGVSIALFSVSMLATATAGLAEGARIRVGADLSLTAATTLTRDQVDAVARIPGVQRTATVEWAGGLRLTAGGESSEVSGYLVDPRSWMRCRRTSPGRRVSPRCSPGRLLDGRVQRSAGGPAGSPSPAPSS